MMRVACVSPPLRTRTGDPLHHLPSACDLFCELSLTHPLPHLGLGGLHVHLCCVCRISAFLVTGPSRTSNC